MNPTDILKEEHELILVMLKVIDRVCDRLSRGEKIKPEHLSDIIDFIRGFADGCHHAKEEKLLFPALEQAGIARTDGPVGFMLAEHAMGRNYVTLMDEALGRYKAGDPAASEKFVENAKGYIELLNGHIMKENNVLFVMANQRLSGEKQKELLEGFERIEIEETGEGVHEKYHGMLHHMRDIYMPEV